MDTLPIWLQWLAAIAGILSSVGVIIAFVQLRISGEQFNKQLKLTEEQFKLSNQGYVKLTLNQGFVSDEIKSDTPVPLNNQTHYKYSTIEAKLENVGNLPVKLNVISFQVFFNKVEAYSAPKEILTKAKDIVYPKTDLKYELGKYYYNEAHTPLLYYEIEQLNITYKILIHYHDYNDNSKRNKTIDREAKLIEGKIISTSIEDVL